MGTLYFHLYKLSRSLQDLAYHLSVSIVTVQTLGGDTFGVFCVPCTSYGGSDVLDPRWQFVEC